MTDDKGVFDGFDFLANMLVRDDSNPNRPVITDDDNDNIQDISPEELQRRMKENSDDVDDNDDQDNQEDQDDQDNQNDLRDTKKDTKKDVKKEDKKDKDDDYDPEFEKEISTYFATEFSKKLGIELDDDSEIDSIDDVLDLLNTVVEENSKPTYSSEEVERFDEYVRQGGDLKNFYDQVYANRIDLDHADIKDESIQKAVIKEHLNNQGYSEAKIKRAIERYEESGVLEEEAEDAIELLKEFNKKNAEKLLNEQQEYFKEQQKMKQEFLRNVNSTMKDISELAGVSISDKEKKDLLNYIFATDREGMTPFQRDAQKDIMSLLEVAFFTKNKDKVINKTKKKAASDAYKTLQEKIKMQKGKLGKSGSQTQDDNSDLGSLGNFGKGIIF